MGRPKKKVVVGGDVFVSEVSSKEVIQPLSVDFSSEGLNDMARKINEIITFINK